MRSLLPALGRRHMCSIIYFHNIPFSLHRRVLHGCISRFFAASMAFAIGSKARLPLFPFGLTFRCCKIHFMHSTVCCGLLLCSPFSGGYTVSAHPVTQMHWLPATWPPDRYQDWTFTSEQMMTFQDTRAGVRPQIVPFLFNQKPTRSTISLLAG